MIGRARLRPASTMACGAFHALIDHLDGEIDEQDGVLRHDAHQHQDTDENRHGHGVVCHDQADRHAADGERQREQDGEGLDHVLEEQDQNNEDQHQAEQHGIDEALLHFRLYFRVAALKELHARRQFCLFGDRLEAVGGRIERHADRQIGTHGHNAVAVVALDRAWPFRIVDVGDRRERHQRAGGSLDLQVADGAEIGAEVRVDLDADRDLPVVERHLGQGRVDIADRGDADDVGNLRRRDAETGHLVCARPDLQFRAGQGAVRADIGEKRFAAQLGFKQGNGGVQILVIVGEQVEGKVTLAAVVELEDAHIRDGAHCCDRPAFRSAHCGMIRPAGGSLRHDIHRSTAARPQHVIDQLVRERMIEFVAA